MMPDIFTVLLETPSLLAMWGALLFHWVYPAQGAFSPKPYWHKLATEIAVRVHHTTDSRTQQRLAGTLTLMLLSLTTLVFCIALQQVVWMQWFLDFLLLWFALNWRPLHESHQRLAGALSREDKLSAREALAPQVNRDTSSLSAIGLGKAGAETLTVGYCRQLISVLFWYALLGGPGAFTYALTMQLARMWSPNQVRYQDYGLPVSKVMTLLDWLPTRLFALLIAAGKNGYHALSAIKQQGQQWREQGKGWLLAAIGTKFQLALGGPVVYDQQKLKRKSIGGDIAPTASHLMLVSRHLWARSLLWIGLQSLLMFLGRIL
ncbi:adenosylcobinamide-phosphate synthase [Veronia nyctiphanis]|uniref:Adenosylcobinamide-phosphate synthase n=1 Tax=Veronia nyctiphanis TaxID=1278244 RepID=A0A4Q0YRG2_9GAMM|nr:cobalamin biosynthesis family protein [Veronia nyctiphanis]RXJ73760.1 adenosylcobinamide-phosphate synthase [Veronia nyctiphanis]